MTTDLVSQSDSQPDRPIPTNSLAFEYVYVANQRCACGGHYAVTHQRLGRAGSGPVDQLTAACEACDVERTFTFNISSFFGEFEKYNRFQQTEERFRRAMVFIRAGELDQAEKILQQVVDPEEGEPAFAWAHFHLGNVLMRQGSVEAALMHLERAAAIQPLAPVIHEALGQAYRVAGNAGGAESRLRRAEALRAQFADSDGHRAQER
ncbi:MAG: tetratricopeptide repeat protein [Anaerolineae bacterium]|jgi:predicted Zn-dependent protease